MDFSLNRQSLKMCLVIREDFDMKKGLNNSQGRQVKH